MTELRSAVCRSRAGVASTIAALGLLALSGCEHREPGEALWIKNCADCHGIDGSGNTPRYMGNNWADLLDDSWKTAGDEYTIRQVVREGAFGQMPANSTLSDEEISLIIDWLYHLRGETR